MIYIYPYKLASESARTLREGLSRVLGYRVKLVKPDGKFNPRRKDKVINWGNSTLPKWEFNQRDLNDYTAIQTASNKLESFMSFKLHNVPTPEWTTNLDEAKAWFTKKGTTVLCRTVLNGHSGRGIVVSDNVDQLVPAPLYVKYKKKQTEFRVHVCHGTVIDTQQKKKRNGFKEQEGFNHKIRNHQNGWIYARDGILPSPDRDQLAVNAVKAIGLDFGAVDIIYNELETKYYVLEVNTAPGLDGETINKYVRAFAQ